jgi:hypothetical protein
MAAVVHEDQSKAAQMELANEAEGQSRVRKVLDQMVANVVQTKAELKVQVQEVQENLVRALQDRPIDQDFRQDRNHQE